MARCKLELDSLKRLQGADVFLFDVDDTLYPIDCGLHELIKQRICDHANSMADIDKSWRDLINRNYQAGILAQPEAILAGLDRFFPMIIQKVFSDSDQAGLHEYLSEIYAVDYNLVGRNPALAQGIMDLQAQGKRVLFYTNGPASGDAAKPLHVENMLARLGLEPDAFATNNIFDLNRARPFGRGKPTVESAEDMLAGLEIEPGKTIAFFDDVTKNLAAFKDPRIIARNLTITVWCQTYSRPTKPKSLKDLSPDEQKHVDIICTDIGEMISQIASSANGMISVAKRGKPRMDVSRQMM